MKAMLAFLKSISLKKMRVSYNDTDKAFNKVRNELFKLGFFSDVLDEVECEYQQTALGAFININYIKLAKFPGSVCVSGYFDNENKIFIPGFVIGRDCSTLDTIRHEFGHALAIKNKPLFNSNKFIKAFGGRYGEKAPYQNKNWEEYCVSAYAATSTQEDFAETFMLFLKQKGKMKKKQAQNKYIKAKWKFIESIKILSNSK